MFRVIPVHISPHWDCMRENQDQNNSEYGHFLRSANDWESYYSTGIPNGVAPILNYPLTVQNVILLV